MSAPSITIPSPTLKQFGPMSKVEPFSEATGIPNRTIRRALNRGELPGVRVGRVWYVNTAAALAKLGLSE